MSSLKRAVLAVSMACVLAIGCFVLGGCGEQIAATWAHGQVTEDEVTTTIENMRSNYGLTDSSTWKSFIENKSYDTSSSSSSSDSSSSSSSSDSSSESSTGTVQDLRTYVINQLIREQIIKYEVEQQGITVSDDEVNAYVEQVKKSVESQYMEGVFESVLQQQGYKDLDAYKDEVREQLAEQKLEEQTVGSTSDSSKWDSYVDGLVSYAEVKINDAPSNLSYDPANASSSSSSSDTASSDTSSSDTSSDTSTESSSSNS